MRSKVTDVALNKNLLNRIARLDNLYEAALHPDNVKYMPSHILNKAGSLLQKLKASVDAGVNGVEFDDVNAYINYLGSTQIEHEVIEIDEIVMDSTDGLSTKRDKKETNINVPDGFDGRSAFVFVKLFGLCAGDVADDSFRGQAVEATEIPYTMDYDQWLLIAQTKKKISFNTFLLRAFKHRGETYDRLYLRGYIVLWRNK